MPSNLLLLILLLGSLGFSSGADVVCRLSIPDSGGASYAPDINNLPPGTTSVVVDSDGLQCDGPAGCENNCCSNPDCLAWSWSIAGSVHSPCGGTECNLILTPLPSNFWVNIGPFFTLLGGYNYAGFIYSNSSSKDSCCGGGGAQTTFLDTLSFSPLPSPIALFSSPSFSPSPSLSALIPSPLTTTSIPPFPVNNATDTPKSGAPSPPSLTINFLLAISLFFWGLTVL